MTNKEQLAEAREIAAVTNLGNNNSSKIKRLMNDTLHRVLVQNEALRARKITEALVTKAEDGDVSAIREVFDRIEGKAVSTNEIRGTDGQDLVIRVITGIDA